MLRSSNSILSLKDPGLRLMAQFFTLAKHSEITNYTLEKQILNKGKFILSSSSDHTLFMRVKSLMLIHS